MKVYLLMWKNIAERKIKTGIRLFMLLYLSMYFSCYFQMYVQGVSSQTEKSNLALLRIYILILLIFLVLRVHEIGTFMLNSSVFIFLILHVLYGSICQHFLFPNKFWIILTFRGLFQVIKNNKPSKYIFFFKLKVFWWNEAVEVIEATEVVEAVEVIEAIEAI